MLAQIGKDHHAEDRRLLGDVGNRYYACRRLGVRSNHIGRYPEFAIPVELGRRDFCDPALAVARTLFVFNTEMLCCF